MEYHSYLVELKKNIELQMIEDYKKYWQEIFTDDFIKEIVETFEKSIRKFNFTLTFTKELVYPVDFIKTVFCDVLNEVIKEKMPGFKIGGTIMPSDFNNNNYVLRIIIMF